MNAKKAKKLRQLVKMAARDSEGIPLPKEGYIENNNNRKFVTVEKVSGDGKSTYKDKELVSIGTIRIAPRTVRGIYRGMKKKYTEAMAS